MQDAPPTDAFDQNVRLGARATYLSALAFFGGLLLFALAAFLYTQRSFPYLFVGAGIGAAVAIIACPWLALVGWWLITSRFREHDGDALPDGPAAEPPGLAIRLGVRAVRAATALAVVATGVGVFASPVITADIAPAALTVLLFTALGLSLLYVKRLAVTLDHGALWDHAHDALVWLTSLGLFFALARGTVAYTGLSAAWLAPAVLFEGLAGIRAWIAWRRVHRELRHLELHYLDHAEPLSDRAAASLDRYRRPGLPLPE